MESRYLKINRWGSAAVIFVFLTMLGACSPVSTPKAGPVHKLFELEPGMPRAEMQISATGFLSRLLAAPSTQELRLVDAAPGLISGATDELSIPVSDDETVDFHQKSFQTTPTGLLVWSGDVASDRKARFKESQEVNIDPLNNVMIVRNGNKLSGTLQYKGQLYNLEALENGRHAFIKVDESKLPTEANPINDSVQDSASSPNNPATPKSAHSTISVLMVTTIQSRAKWPNIESDIQLALARANQANAESGVDITFQLAHIDPANWNESGTSTTMLANLRNANNPLGIEVAKLRDLYRGDVVSMVITAPENCGLGYLSAHKSTAFTVITCFDSLVHELGHSMGANHDWDPATPVTDPSYNHGNLNRTVAPLFRTLMAYACGSVTCPKMNLWSTPNKTYSGLPLGTVLYSDNVRRLNERREAVENYYPAAKSN